MLARRGWPHARHLLLLRLTGLAREPSKFLWQHSAVAGLQATLMGVSVAEVLETLEIAAPHFASVAFSRGDFVVDRSHIRSLEGHFSAALYFRIDTRKRIDGVQDFNAIKPTTLAVC